MIIEINKSVNKLNQVLGLKHQLPVPTKKSLQTTQYLNAAATATCLTLSTVFTSKTWLGLGVISAVSFVVTSIEKNKL